MKKERYKYEKWSDFSEKTRDRIIGFIGGLIFGFIIGLIS